MLGSVFFSIAGYLYAEKKGLLNHTVCGGGKRKCDMTLTFNYTEIRKTGVIYTRIRVHSGKQWFLECGNSFQPNTILLYYLVQKPPDSSFYPLIPFPERRSSNNTSPAIPSKESPSDPLPKSASKKAPFYNNLGTGNSIRLPTTNSAIPLLTNKHASPTNVKYDIN